MKRKLMSSKKRKRYEKYLECQKKREAFFEEERFLEKTMANGTIEEVTTAMDVKLEKRNIRSQGEKL
jgi:hypothetical protein